MNQFKGILYAIISSATFGLIPLFAIPALNEGVSLNNVLFYRLGLSALLLFVYLLFRKTSFHVSFKKGGTLVILAILYSSTSIMLTGSYLYIPSGIATTIHFLYPVIVSAIMILFFKDKLTLPVIISIFLSIGGVFLLSQGESHGPINAKGLLMVLSTIFTYALYIVGVNRSAVAKMDGTKLAFYVLFIGTLIFTVNIYAHGEQIQIIPTLKAGINLSLLALVPTLISNLTLVLAIKNVGSTTTAILGCMEPLTALCVGTFYLNEMIGIHQISGVIIIIIAVVIVILSRTNLWNFRTRKKKDI